MALIMEQFIIAENQQVSLCELSWLGGIIDGEGCLTIDKHGGRRDEKGKCSVNPMIIIVNTDQIIMDKVQDILKKNGIPFYIYIHPPKKTWKRKIEIVIRGYKRIRKFLPIITPFLIGKLEKANLLNEFCLSRLEKYTNPYTEEEKEMCRKIWLLNNRGTNHWQHKNLND